MFMSTTPLGARIARTLRRRVSRAFCQRAVIGFLMEKELRFLGDELENPERPFVVMLGGAKVSDKIKVIDRLLEKADTILIGGAMAYTFALAHGRQVGKSLAEPDKVETAQAGARKGESARGEVSTAGRYLHRRKVRLQGEDDFPGQIHSPDEGIPDGWKGVDVGPATIKLFSAEIANAADHSLERPDGRF